MAKKYLASRQDSAQWDWPMFMQDMEKRDDLDLPFSSGLFPVPNYDVLVENSFEGLGNFGFPGGEELEMYVGHKRILFNSFFVRSNFFNRPYVPKGAADEVYFHLVVLTDYVDTVNYSHLSSEVVPRNHPDYIGQGFYKTLTNRIDYVAFLTADRNAYAIINMRLFDLKNGKTILIAPQSDRSLRSWQINSPVLSSREIENYTKMLLEKEEVKHFFLDKGAI